MNIRASQTVVIAALGAVAALILVAGALLVVEPQRSHEHRLNEAVSAAQAKLDAAHAPARDVGAWRQGRCVGSLQAV